MDVGHLEGDMVQSFPFLFNEFTDDTAGLRALEQLDLGVADPKKSGHHIFRFHGFSFIAGRIQ
jgi:hypothetical protein